MCSGWGGGSPSPTITQAINNAAVSGRSGSGALIFFSSGNDGRNPPVYPSYLDNVVSVGGSTPHDQKKHREQEMNFTGVVITVKMKTEI
ncbi:MAG: S8 family serine peptidase [Ignavibacteria bacterium]